MSQAYRIAAGIIARRLPRGDGDVQAARQMATENLVRLRVNEGLVHEVINDYVAYMEGNTELARYHRLLATHDWAYEFSDDHSMWRRGCVERHVLNAMAAQLDHDRSIWRLYDPGTH